MLYARLLLCRDAQRWGAQVAGDHTSRVSRSCPVALLAATVAHASPGRS